MATLTANINATQTVIPVSGAEPMTGSHFTLGSEALRFLGTSRGPQGRSFLRSYWSVDRGVAGTTKATHLSGATLTQYYPDAAGSEGGSGVNVDNGTDPPAAVTTLVAPGAVIDDGTATLLGVRLIGPFPIAFDDAGLDTDGVTLATLPAGTVILNAWPEITTQWDFDVAGGNWFIGVSADFATCKQYAIPGGNTSLPVTVGANAASELGQVPASVNVVVRLITEGPLLALVDLPSRTAGEADIYAIVATPAS